MNKKYTINITIKEEDSKENNDNTLTLEQYRKLETMCNIYNKQDIEKEFEQVLDSAFDEILLFNQYIVPYSKAAKAINQNLYYLVMDEYIQDFFETITVNNSVTLYVAKEDAEKFFKLI